jgi:hypothetical protein
MPVLATATAIMAIGQAVLPTFGIGGPQLPVSPIKGIKGQTILAQLKVAQKNGNLEQVVAKYRSDIGKLFPAGTLDSLDAFVKGQKLVEQQEIPPIEGVAAKLTANSLAPLNELSAGFMPDAIPGTAESEATDNSTLYLAGGIGVLLLVGLILFVAFKK